MKIETKQVNQLLNNSNSIPHVACVVPSYIYWLCHIHALHSQSHSGERGSITSTQQPTVNTRSHLSSIRSVELIILVSIQCRSRQYSSKKTDGLPWWRTCAWNKCKNSKSLSRTRTNRTLVRGRDKQNIAHAHTHVFENGIRGKIELTIFLTQIFATRYHSTGRETLNAELRAHANDIFGGQKSFEFHNRKKNRNKNETQSDGWGERFNGFAGNYLFFFSAAILWDWETELTQSASKFTSLFNWHWPIKAKQIFKFIKMKYYRF